jgi:hypothetical protein
LHSLLDFSFEEALQIALKSLLRGRLSTGREPVFEVPDPNLVLDLGLFDSDRNRRILMDPVDPVVLTKHVQSASYGFIETARRDFDGMFRTVRIETRYPASSKPHARRLASSFFFRQKFDAFTRKRVMKKLAIVGACMRFNPFSMPVTKWIRKNDP